MMTDNRVAQELIDAVEKQMREDLVIPAGTWEAVLIAYQERDPQTDPAHATYGHTIYSTNWQLFDVRGEGDVTGRNRTLNFIDICPTLIRNKDNKIDMRSVLAAQLAKATGTGGQPITAAFDEAKTRRMKLKVTVSTKGDKPKNWVNNITAA
jgi:hypothetical protein